MQNRTSRVIFWLAIALATPVAAQTGTDDPASTPADEKDPALEALKKKTARINAEKDLATAEAALATAKFGGPTKESIPANKIDLVANQKPTAESLLMISRSFERLGTAIAARVNITEIKGNFIIVSDAADLALADLARFEFLKSQIEYAAQVADERHREMPKNPPAAAGTNKDKDNKRSIAAITAGITGVAKLAELFNSEYEYGEASANLPNLLLESAVAAQLPARTVIASRIMPVQVQTFLKDQVAPTSRRCMQNAARGAAIAPLLENPDLKGSDKVKLLQAAAAYQEVLKQCNSFDTLLKGPDTGAPGIITVLRQQRIRELLETKDGTMHLLHVSAQQAGAYYTKKNLWTFLGGPPLHVMGGGAATYTLINPVTSYVTTSGVVVDHGGYRSINRVEGMIGKAGATKPAKTR